MSDYSRRGQEGTGQDDFSHSSEKSSGAVDPQVSFTLSLNSAVYFQDPEVPLAPHMIARLILRATVTPPVVLEFFSLQHFDLVIINDAGDEVFRWSAGRAFPMIASNVPVFGEEQWTVDVTLADPAGALLPAGHYIAQSFLVTRTDPGTRNPVAFAKKYAASVEFSIQNRREPPVYKAEAGDSVFDLVVPKSGPHGPVRSDEFGMVGVFDIDWLTDTRFERLLDNMMGSPGAFKRVRVFKCLNSGAQESGIDPSPVTSSGIVWPNVAAPMNFSLTLNGLAEIASRGLIPHVVLGFFPSAVSPSPVAPPASYGNWKTLVTGFLNALAADARFGAAALGNWWFEVWNEPNNPNFWSGAQADYFKLYDATAEAVGQWQTASGVKIRLGGPAIVYDPQWMQDFLTHVSGPPPLPKVQCDFLSLHQKGNWNPKVTKGVIDSGLPANQPDLVSVVNAMDATATAAKNTNAALFRNIPIVNDESDMMVMFNIPYLPRMEQNFAAWLSGLTIAYDALSSQYSANGFRFFAASDNANQQLIKGCFDGRRSIMTQASRSFRDLFKAPVYNFYEFLRLLGDRHGSFITGGNNYFPNTDLFHAITVADTYIGSIFSIFPRSRGVSPGAWTLNYSIVDIPWAKVNIARFQIDGTLSNGFAKAGGTLSVPFPNAAGAQGVRQAQELKLFAPIQRNVALPGKKFHETFTIKPYTVMIYWITEATADKPADPVWIEAALEDGNVILRWQPNLEPWFYSYEVYLMDGREPGVMISPDPLRPAMWVDTGPGAGTRTYGVRAVSASGIRSALVVSNPVVV